MQNSIRRHAFDIFKGNYTFIEGHRGMNKLCPQNTVSSFKKSIEKDLDSVELDIWLTKDLIPVVIHGGDNGEIEEFTTGKGNVKEMTFKELSKYHTKEGDQPVPAFEEVLQVCKDKMFINVELKDDRLELTFEKVIALIEKYKMHNQIAFSSFKHGYYDIVHKYSEKNKIPLEFGFLYEDKEKKEKYKPYRFDIGGKISMNIIQKDINKEIVEKAHSKGYAVHCWFCMKNDESDEIYERLIKCGVDVICCNQPDKAKMFRDKYYSK